MLLLNADLPLNLHRGPSGITKAAAPVRKVAFFSGTQSLGEVDAPPYTFSWQNVPVGRHAVKAVAYDAKGAETPSPTRWISAGPVGRLKVEWKPALQGFWQLSGATNGTERLREPRELNLGTDGEWLLGLAGGGDARLQMRDGLCSLQNPRNAGVAFPSNLPEGWAAADLGTVRRPGTVSCDAATKAFTIRSIGEVTEQRGTFAFTRVKGDFVYWGVVVVLMSAMQHGHKPVRVEVLRETSRRLLTLPSSGVGLAFSLRSYAALNLPIA